MARCRSLPYYSRLFTLDYLGLSDRRVLNETIEERTMIAHEHAATPEYLQANQIAIFDVNRMLIYRASDRIHEALRSAREWVAEMNAGTDILRVKCRKTDGLRLIYATTLDDEQHDRVFARLDPCGSRGSR